MVISGCGWERVEGLVDQGGEIGGRLGAVVPMHKCKSQRVLSGTSGLERQGVWRFGAGILVNEWNRLQPEGQIAGNGGGRGTDGYPRVSQGAVENGY
jgi:hypothetical protein